MNTVQNQNNNTLRLNQRELHKLLETLEQRDGEDKSPDREFVRWSYRVESVNLVIEHSSGNKVNLPVATRNISRGGISILHSAFMHTGTPCEILLRLPGGNTQSVQGTVRRCAHLTGRVHEIGIQFKNQISTKTCSGSTRSTRPTPSNASTPPVSTAPCSSSRPPTWTATSCSPT